MMESMMSLEVEIPPISLALAQEIANHFGQVPMVEAVVLAGSTTAGTADSHSDLDLYVYYRAEVPISFRTAFIAPRARQTEINNQFWETEDAWIETASGTKVEIMYRDLRWTQEHLHGLLQHHRASTGYTTCIWHNIATSHILVDGEGWFRALQESANQPYPDGLVRAIIAKNHPLLRGAMSSYLHQMERALQLDDLASLSHRTAAFLASYFDIVFAVNHVLHPGEKRMLKLAEQKCAKLPAGMRDDVTELLHTAAKLEGGILEITGRLIDSLDALLMQEDLLPLQ